ncbi:competence type IV pilus ATPase ComGA [Fundicoccus culcitae]|uniref:Competence type IV pilus ATPase ComGA n=1 Tax=Fundicoccus culcitae TaxID=2969821 RepID=A0ABY5P665_9LACT|nr:competence type IV pilus ATPase ComGA [Fundicoccus culcitae]UUX34232.1 competence type IV pilus ATPase ComGA [Fundicoccus culcitae]
MIETLAQAIIKAAVSSGVSDIHILPQSQLYHVYFRVNSQLVFYQHLSIDLGKRFISYFKFLADMDVGEKRKPQSGAAQLPILEQLVELRMSTITNVNLLESLVIRVFAQQPTQNQTIQTYFPNDLVILRQLFLRKSGLILFSGPVGSGKTTTIYQLLRERIAQEPLQVMTMEDPVEIYEQSFLQTQVNEKAGISYDTLIRASLRHHPDILLIGEIRDETTAKMVIRGALTGHLMIATIHAKNALGVIARLQELGISDEQLRQTLIGIISQRLVPRLCCLCHDKCHRYCTHLPTHQKRSAILEILTADELHRTLYQKTEQALPTLSLNRKLRKAWAYGYITEKAYQQFELV